MASPLAVGAGASEGLDTFLARLLLQQQVDQRGQAETETNRHNLATEAQSSRALDVTDAERKSRDAALEAVRQDQNQARSVTEGRTLGDTIPPKTFISPDDPAVNMMGKGGVLSLLQKQDERPPVDAGPLLPGDTGASKLAGFIKLPSSSQAKEAAAEAEKGVVDKRGQATLDERSRHDKAMENKPPAPDRVLIQSGDGYIPRSAAAATLAGGGTVPAPTPAQARNREGMAGKVLSHFDDIQNEIDEADKMGVLGPIEGRTFGDFMAGKIGSTGDPVKDELLGSLRMDMSAVRSGFASLHGRGGANTGMAKDIEKNMDSGHMSRAELTGALKQMKKWVTGYATDGKDQNGGGVPSVGGTFNGAKVLKVTPLQ